MNLWFVTPAWGRTELSKIIFSQRRELCSALKARCVVIADDENLDIARINGMDTVEQANRPLGRKINDGFEYARANGATHVCNLDSDSWALPEYFCVLPTNQVFSSKNLGVVSEDGKTLAHLGVHNEQNPFGAGPFVVPIGLIPKRPLPEDTQESWQRLLIEANGLSVTYDDNPHRWKEVTFKYGHNLNGYASLKHMAVETFDDPWRTLGEVYPNYLIQKMRLLYG